MAALSYVMMIPGLILSLGFILMGALAAAAALSQLKVAWAMQRWPSTLAEVRSSRIVTTSRGYYEPRLEYAFTVDGEEIFGKRRALYTIAKLDRVWADTIVSENPAGAHVTVYYDPTNPRQCVLTRENARSVGAVLPFVGFAFAAIGIALLDYVARRGGNWWR